MQIPDEILNECHAHGVDAYPEESCGFIVGNLNDLESLETVFPMRNIMNKLHKEDPLQFPRTALDGYMIDPSEHMKLERYLKKIGKKIKIIYHSHPDVGAYFSEKDKQDALWNGKARYPGISFLVCATNQGRPGNSILVNFNVKKSDFDISKIPAKNNNPTRKVLGGIFGISGILPTLNFIHEWQNGKRELEYGYFRFVSPKQVKKLQHQLAFRYQARHAIAYSSGRSALLELISYLNDSGSLTKVYLASKKEFITNALQSLGIHFQFFNLNENSSVENLSATKGNVVIIYLNGQKTVFAENSKFFQKFSESRIPVIIYEEENRLFWQKDIQLEWNNGINYWITDLITQKGSEFISEIKGGLILSDNDRHMAELIELRKRRGAILSARNANLFCKILVRNTNRYEKKYKNFSKTSKIYALRDEKAVVKKLCKLENASTGLLFPSGMSAIMALMTLLRKNNKPRLIIIGLLYSETYSLLLNSGCSSKFETIFLGVNELDLLPEFLTSETSMVFTESLTNPLCEVPDLERIGKLANSKAVPFLVDNTLASPVNCQPINWGADYVIHSTTKYLSGKNDHAGGAILVKNQQNSNSLIEFQQNWGLMISNLETKILHKRLYNFEDRMQRFNANNLVVAHFLESHPAVANVYYAFSQKKLSNAISSKFLSGSGGVVSFVLKNDTEDNLRKFYDGEFKSILKAPTLGSDKTLVCPYSMLTHYHDSDDELKEINLPRHLIRIASGSEKKIEPIINDLKIALERTSK